MKFASLADHTLLAVSLETVGAEVTVKVSGVSLFEGMRSSCAFRMGVLDDAMARR